MAISIAGLGSFALTRISLEHGTVYMSGVLTLEGGYKQPFDANVPQAHLRSRLAALAAQRDAFEEVLAALVKRPDGTPLLGATAESLPSKTVSIGLPVGADASLAVGETLQLSAAIEDVLGRDVADRSAAWQSSDPAVAAVDATGLVTARAAGGARIVATSDNASAELAVTVAA